MKSYWFMLSILVGILIMCPVLAQTNVLINGDIETIEPAFWSKLNGTSECVWADDAHSATALSRRSLKVVKSGATAQQIGWVSDNNADLYWNNAGSGLFDLRFKAKTEGVNTNPANDDAKIGLRFKYYAASSLIAEQFVEVDQSVASKDWTDYTGGVLVSSEPDQVILEAVMGKDATGTVWFDDLDCNTNAGWTMGVFNADAETPQGWMMWSTDHGFANFVADAGAHSGSYDVLLEENDANDDEMVFYSEPGPATAGKWYRFSVWMKTENVNTDTGYFATNVTPDRDNDRLGMCFFFHKGPIKEQWDLVGGDQYFYLDQRPGKENEGWRYYAVVAQAPDEAAGVSVRARFTSFCTGKVWYDDFMVEEIQPLTVSIEDPARPFAYLASEYRLANNYPNPFNPITVIEYSVPQAGNVELAIYNMMGQKIRTLVDASLIPGIYQTIWDGTDEQGIQVSAGVYFYQLRGQNALITRKMTFIK